MVPCCPLCCLRDQNPAHILQQSHRQLILCLSLLIVLHSPHDPLTAAEALKGYERIMRSHLTVAAAIADGEADLAIGTERVSRQIDGIDFIPLMEERFDLGLPFCT